MSIKAALGEQTIAVTDIGGKEHKLLPLRLGDLAELEEMCGDLKNFSKWGSKLRSLLTILWLALRREGLSFDQISRGEWAYTMTSIGQMFPASINGTWEIVDKILGGSGLTVKKEPDPSLPTPETTTGVSSSPAA